MLLVVVVAVQYSLTWVFCAAARHEWGGSARLLAVAVLLLLLLVCKVAKVISALIEICKHYLNSSGNSNNKRERVQHGQHLQ